MSDRGIEGVLALFGVAEQTAWQEHRYPVLSPEDAAATRTLQWRACKRTTTIRTSQRHRRRGTRNNGHG
jgi:hypothetical protein